MTSPMLPAILATNTLADDLSMEEEQVEIAQGLL